MCSSSIRFNSQIISFPVFVITFVNIFIISCVYAGDKSISELLIDKHIANSSKILNSISANKINLTHSKNTGFVSFLRTASDQAISLSVKGTNAENRARQFIADNKDAFLDANTSLELIVKRRQEADENGQSFVHFQQTVNGVFVRGGEIIVHMDTTGVTSVNSKLQSGLGEISTTPSINPVLADTIAKDFIINQSNAQNLSTNVPKLEIFNNSVFENSVSDPSLAWFVEVTDTFLQEFIWVDAHSGAILKNLSQMARIHARERQVFDGGGLCGISANLVRKDFDPATSIPPDLSAATGILDIDAAYDLSGVVYDYYLNVLGRDGIAGNLDPNGEDLSINSMVNVCPEDLPVNREKAIWSSSDTAMIFAAGYSQADDIVAHEYSHGVIEYSANFLLQGETGALAEAYADIFAESVHIWSSGQNEDLAVRWQIGEAAPLGPFRNMKDPNLFSHPAKVTDSLFVCDLAGNTGIHINNGVLNHAYALLVDGGNFNGLTITGLGPEKAAKIFYKALVEHSTSTDRFIDAYNALLAAADILVTLGTLSASDRTQLTNALDAVELNVSPCSNSVAFCPVGQVPNYVFQDDFESIDNGNWKTALGVAAGFNHWNQGTGTPDIYHIQDDITGVIARSGQYALWANTSNARALGDSWVEMTSSITLPTNALMQFEHNFIFEKDNADGGVVEISTDGGATWRDVQNVNNQNLFSAGQLYNGTIDVGAQGNPLAGRTGFTDYMLLDDLGNPLNDYASTQLDLNSLAGQSVRFRFRVGTDTFGVGRGWLIDDIGIYSCVIDNSVGGGGSSSKSGGGGLSSLLVYLGFLLLPLIYGYRKI